MTWSKATGANEDDITKTLEDSVPLKASFYHRHCSKIVFSVPASYLVGI